MNTENSKTIEPKNLSISLLTNVISKTQISIQQQ